MKSILALFCMAMLLHNPSIAQSDSKSDEFFYKLQHGSVSHERVFTYTLSTGMQTYSNLTGAISVNNGEVWDDPEYAIPITFPFEINGNPATTVFCYGVGFAVAAETSDPDVNTVLFPFEADLIDRGYDDDNSLSPISYKVEGAVGSRIEKIEFRNAGAYEDLSENGTSTMFVNVQCWLFEGSNKIEFHYGPSSITDTDLFYSGETGAAIGVTDFNENEELFINAHFIAGNASKPTLFDDISFLNGTPPNGMVYILSLGDPLEVNVSITNGDSYCDPNGTATANVSGGAQPYTYHWNNGATTSSITGLDAGTYTVTVEDSNGETASANGTVTNSDEMELSGLQTDETAVNANDGTASITVDGGNSPYTYLWSNGETTASVEDLAPGVYSVTVTDDSGCTESALFDINAFGCPELLTEYTVSNVSCFGLCDGNIEILDVVNGVSPFLYEWDQGSSGSSIDNLCIGTYVITITDANGCFVLDIITITQPTELHANATSTDESYVGQHDGTATANPSGGTAPYSYNWSNGSTTASISNLAPGSYSVVVADSHGCTATQQVNVAAGGCGILTAEIINALCFNNCDGSITVTFENGVAPITYEWSNGDDTPLVFNLCAGTYSVTATDNAGCELVDTFVISQPEPLFANASSTDETIAGGDGTAWVTPEGGIAPYTYAWSNGSTDSLITGLFADEYAVLVTDVNGCVSVQTVTVNEFVCVDAFLIPQDNSACADSCTGQITTVIEGGAGPFIFLWNTGDTTGAIGGLCPEHYTLTITNVSESCSSIFETEIEQADALQIFLDDVVHVGDTAISAILISVEGGSPPYSFIWTGPNGYINFQEDVFDIEPGTYSVVVEDGTGCAAFMDSIEVLDHTVGIIPIFKGELNLYPNPTHDQVFIPNSDVTDFTCEIWTLQGQKIKTYRNEHTLTLGGLAEGMYIVKLITDNSLYTTSVLLQR